MSGRRGIFAAGNWVVDRIKTVDRYPAPGMLATVLEERTALGGGPHNVLMNLAVLDPGLPLYAGGILGDDADAGRILEALAGCRIDTSALERRDGCLTSVTDVMTERETGIRTFFHRRGANAAFGVPELTGARNPARIAHLAYLLILDSLDAPDPEYGVAAARALAELGRRGCKTSVDLVSEEGDRFEHVVRPVLPYTDYLIVNEIEAGRTAGIPLRGESGRLEREALPAVAETIFGLGLRECCVIHYPEGSFAMDRRGESWSVPAFDLEPAEIVGTVGAGDAFCAGMLYGFHEGWTPDQAMELASAMAAVSLSSPDSVGAARPLPAILRYMEDRRRL